MGVPEKFLSVAEKLRELGATNVEIAYVWDRTKDGDGYKDDTKIHEALKEINPELAERFYKEMRIKVWRTDFRREHFNRKRIVESLLRETKVSRGLAEKIAKEVEEKIRSTDVSIITSPLIRELVLARLIELGLSDEYTRYMRLGIPVYDLERAMERGNVEERILQKIMTQYVLFEVLPRESVELFLDGAWEIKGITKPYLPFAKAFVLRTPKTKTWLKGLFSYLLEKDYVDRPSIYVPPHIYEEDGISELLSALSEWAILWSEENLSKDVVVSDVPIYSFGKADGKIISDVFVVRADKIAESVKTVQGFERQVEKIENGMEKYREFKERFVKKGVFYTIVDGIEEAAKSIYVEEEKIREIFEPLKPLQTT